MALATAVVGTLWNAKPWGKTVIIVLAVLAAGAAVLESQKKTRETTSAKRNLELLIRAVQPPAIFDQAVLEGFRAVAREEGHFISGQDIRESGARLFTFKKLDGEDRVSGIVFVSVGARQRLFVAFSQDQRIKPLIRELVKGKWGEDDLTRDWNEFAINTYEIARHSLGEYVPVDAQFEAQADPKARLVTVKVVLPNGRSLRRVNFDARFLESLKDVPLFERGWRIYEKTVGQVVKQRP